MESIKDLILMLILELTNIMSVVELVSMKILKKTIPFSKVSRNLMMKMTTKKKKKSFLKLAKEQSKELLASKNKKRILMLSVINPIL